MENKAFKIAGIKTLISKNYNLDHKLFDLESMVDDSLSMSENWYNGIKKKVFEMLDQEFKYYIISK